MRRSENGMIWPKTSPCRRKASNWAAIYKERVDSDTGQEVKAATLSAVRCSNAKTCSDPPRPSELQWFTPPNRSHFFPPLLIHEILALNLPDFRGKAQLPIPSPFSSCKIEGLFTFRRYFPGSSNSKPLLVEVQRYKRCKTPLNYSHGVSIKASLWSKGKDLVTLGMSPHLWLDGKTLLVFFWGEVNGGVNKKKHFLYPERAEEWGMQGVSIFQVHPTRESWSHLPFGNTEASPNIYSTRGVKLKWGMGREIANQEIQQERTETTGGGGEGKLIGNSKIIILYFKYSGFSK